MTAVALPLRSRSLLVTLGERAGPDRLFASWLVGRTLLWAALASMALPHPPLDAIEWLCWGREWRLGYHKHPPLAAWAAEVAFQAAGGSFAGLYLLSYASVAVALLACWLLARQILAPWPALAAVLCLDGLVFLGQAAAEFNNQVLLIAFWSLAILWFHCALRGDRLRDWALTGAALGGALLCKYSTVFLILPQLGLWLRENGLRRLSRPA